MRPANHLSCSELQTLFSSIFVVPPPIAPATKHPHPCSIISRCTSGIPNFRSMLEFMWTHHAAPFSPSLYVLPAHHPASSAFFLPMFLPRSRPNILPRRRRKPQQCPVTSIPLPPVPPLLRGLGRSARGITHLSRRGCCVA
jgi:hypothetical protein